MSVASQTLPGPIDSPWTRRIGWVLVLGSVAGMILVSSQRLWDMFTGGLVTLGGVAHLTQQQGNVRWRPISRLAWQSPVKNQDLNLGDRLATSADGPATIQYEIGARVEVSPNSLVVVDQPRGRVTGWSSAVGRLDGSREITLQSGALVVSNLAAQETFGVRFKDRRFEVSMAQQDSQLKVFERSRGEIGFQPFGSPATINAEDWIKPLQVLDGETGVVPTKGKARVVKTPFELAAPTSGEPIFLQPGAKVGFKWNRKDRSVNRTPSLEIRSTPGGAPQTSRESVSLPGGRGRVDHSLGDGTYQWRMVGKDRDGKAFESEWQSFSVVSLRPPSPVLPRVGKTLMTNDSGSSSVHLVWRPRALPSPVEVEVSQNGNVMKTIRTRAPGGMVVDLAPGQYTWRARVWVSDDLQSKWSSARAFNVLSRQQVAQNAIQSLPPQITSERAELRWREVPYIDSYLVELYSSKKASIRRESVMVNRYVVRRGDVPDQFFYQVSASLDGSLTSSTDLIPVSFENATVVPPKVKVSARPKPKPAPAAAAEAKPAAVPADAGPAIGVRQVGAIDAQGTQTAPEVQIGRVSVAGTYSPEDGQDYVIGEEVKIKWPKNSQAKEYVLEVGTEEDFAEPIAVVVSKETSFVFRPPLSGIYFWRVRDVTGAGQDQEWSDVRSFIVQ